MATSTNVTVGKPKTSGAVFMAPIGTTLPTDAVTDLDNAFVELGYVSEDGVTNSNSPSSTDIKAWGGDTVLTTQDEKEDTWTLTLIEAMNINVLKAVYGDTNVTGTLQTGIAIKANSKETEAHAWVIDMIQTGGVLRRVLLPNAKLSELGEITYKDDTAVGYNLTLKALPGADGDTHKEFIGA